MKLSILIPTIAGLLSTAVAAPADSASGALEKRDLPDWANCVVSYGTFYDNFQIQTTGPWADNYGSGLLDNVRGQCGVVTGWTFSYDNLGNGWGYFNLAKIRPDHCVEDAIWLASAANGPISLNCHT